MKQVVESEEAELLNDNRAEVRPTWDASMADSDDDDLSPEQRDQRALFSMRGYVAYKARNHRAQQARDRGETVEPWTHPKPTPTVIHPELQPGTVLMYRIRADDTTVVIALERDARRVDAIRRAIETARTWGEFRTMLPDGEWSDIWDSWCRDGSQWEDVPVGKVDGLRASLADHRPFDSGALPGYLDGDYPVWLQQKMLDILPEDFLQKYGRAELSRLNGDLCVIDEGNLDGILRDLEGRGFIMKDGSALNFF